MRLVSKPKSSEYFLQSDRLPQSSKYKGDSLSRSDGTGTKSNQLRFQANKRQYQTGCLGKLNQNKRTIKRSFSVEIRQLMWWLQYLCKIEVPTTKQCQCANVEHYSQACARLESKCEAMPTEHQRPTLRHTKILSTLPIPSN